MYRGHFHQRHSELFLPFQSPCIGLQCNKTSVAALPASQSPPLAMQLTHQTQVIQDRMPFEHCMAIGIWLRAVLICICCRRVTPSATGCRSSTQPGCCGVASRDQACSVAGLLGHSRSPFSELLSISQSVICTLAPAGESSGAQGTTKPSSRCCLKHISRFRILIALTSSSDSYERQADAFVCQLAHPSS